MGLIALLFSVLLDALRPVRGRSRSRRYGEEDDEHDEDDEDGLSSTVAGQRPVPGSAAAAAAGADAGLPHPLQRHALRLIDWMSSDDADSGGTVGRHLSAPGWVVAVGIPVVLVAGAEAVLGVLGGFFVFLLHVFVLYLTVGLGSFYHRFLELQLLIGAGEERSARRVLQRWMAAGTGGHRVDDGEAAMNRAAAAGHAPEAGGSGTSRLARPATVQAVLAAYRDVFAPLFWYALLPGAIGPVLYLFARFAACHSYPFARTAYDWIDWIPLRLASIGLALAGQFEDAVFSLRAVSGVRTQGGERTRQGPEPEAAPDPFLHQRVLLLPVAGGALGLRLTDAAVDAVLRMHAPDLDLTEADAEPSSLRPAADLLLRSSVLWVSLYLLVKVLD